MKQDEKNMIAGLPFEAATKEIEVIIRGLQSINQLSEDKAVCNLSENALVEALLAEVHLTKAKQIINGEAAESDEEPTIPEMFIKAHSILQELSEYVRNEYASTEDESLMAELNKTNYLIADAITIMERANLRAQGCLRDIETAPRVILQTMGEYFTADHTTPLLRFTGIPKEYRK